MRETVEIVLNACGIKDRNNSPEEVLESKEESNLGK